jgi:hypothetical protein
MYAAALFPYKTAAEGQKLIALLYKVMANVKCCLSNASFACKNKTDYVRFKVPIKTSMRMAIIWDVAQCSLVDTECNSNQF